MLEESYDNIALLKQFFVAIEKLDYALLRNEDRLFIKDRGDLDVIIRKNDTEYFIKAIKFFVQKNNLNSWILEEHYHGLRIVLNSPNNTFFLKLDLHFSECWKGIVLISANEILKDSYLYQSNIKVISNKHKALIQIMESLLNAINIKSRYEKNVNNYLENHTEDLNNILSRNFGNNFLKSTIVGLKMKDLKSQSKKAKTQIYISFLKRMNLDALKIYFHYIITTIKILNKPRGFTNQFLVVGTLKNSKALNEAIKIKTPGFPVLVLDSKFKKNNTRLSRVYRSFEALVFYKYVKNSSRNNSSFSYILIDRMAKNNCQQGFENLPELSSSLITIILENLLPLNAFLKKISDNPKSSYSNVISK